MLQMKKYKEAMNTQYYIRRDRSIYCDGKQNLLVMVQLELSLKNLINMNLQ